MIFGLHGSNILVNIATTMRNQDLSNIEFVPARNGKQIKRRKNKQTQSPMDVLKSAGKLGLEMFNKVQKKMKNEEL